MSKARVFESRPAHCAVGSTLKRSTWMALGELDREGLRPVDARQPAGDRGPVDRGARPVPPTVLWSGPVALTSVAPPDSEVQSRTSMIDPDSGVPTVTSCSTWVR